MNHASLEDLDVYQHSRKLLRSTWALIDNSQLKTVFSIRDQLTRAALSVPLNIAEGYGISRSKFIYHLRIASGSVNEVVCLYSIIEDLYDLDTKALKEDYVHLARRLTLLRKKLRTPRSLNY
jgi:four helix bundle protein